MHVMMFRDGLLSIGTKLVGKSICTLFRETEEYKFRKYKFGDYWAAKNRVAAPRCRAVVPPYGKVGILQF